MPANADTAHWYLRDGTPFYEVPYADRKRRNELRPATLRDARKANAVPSVTTVLKCVHKPGLDLWKREQIVLAALTLPRLEDESDDAFAARIAEEATAYSRAAATLGSQVHTEIEQVLRGEIEVGTLPDETRKIVSSALDWFALSGIHITSLERSFASPLGYGGKIDLVGTKDAELIVLDWKTRTTRPGQPIRPYPEHGVQLEAYARGIELPEAKLLNLYVSTTEPGRVHSHRWSDAEKPVLWRGFQAAYEVWTGILGNNYDPRKG